MNNKIEYILKQNIEGKISDSAALSLIDLIKKSNHKDKAVAVKIPRAKAKKYYPLSYAQEQMYVQAKLDSNATVYIENVVLRSKNRINIKQFNRALEVIARRHTVLKTKFKEVDGKPVQIVDNKTPLKLRLQILPKNNNTKKEEAIEEIIKTPFDLAHEIPFRAVLVRQPKEGDTLIISIHHIATDQWSTQIIKKELFDIYQAYINNEKPDLPPLPIQYKDFAEWERSKENQKRLIAQKEYWLNRLGENPPITKLPLDNPRQSILDYQKGYICDYINNQTIESLRQIASDHNASLFMVLFAITNLCISKLTGKDDIIIGTSISHRYNPNLSNLVGYLSNDIPVRTRLTRKHTFEELLKNTKNNILRDHQYGSYPLEKLIDDLSSTRDTRNIRLFNVNFKTNEDNIKNLCPKNEFNSNSLHSGKIDNHGANNDWAPIFEIFKDKTRLSSRYNTKVLSEKTIKNWTTDLIHLIKQVAEDPEKRIGDYEAVSPQTKDKLLNQFNQTAKRQHPTKAPHHYLEAQAKKTPKNIAVVYQDQKISYEKLNNESNKLANCLMDLNIKNGDKVAVDISEDYYLNIPQAVLGAHKAGVVCLMIDREHPRDRIKYLLEKSQTKAIITDNPAKSYQKDLTKIDITKKLDKYSPEPPKHKGIEGKDTAFITFTSGTTGVPKGIKVTARGMVNEAYNKIKELNTDDIKSIPQNFSLVYNPSLEFISASFVLGKKLVIYPKSELYDPYAVMKRTDKEKIKLITLTPSILNSYLETVEDDFNNRDKIPLKNLKLIDLIGEKIYPGLVKRFYSQYAHITLTSDYGCSEVLTCTNGNIPNKKDLQIVKDGKTTRNQKVYILDKDQKLLPVGATGEIYCSGHGLANGYLGDLKLTQKRFLPHLFIKGERIFRTGDRGRFDNEGNIEAKGRVDDRVKIRGQRVELDEIKEKIKKISGIGDVLIKAWEKKKNYETELVCYYTLKEKGTATAQIIQSVLKREVPKYMIPTYYVELEEFPLNQNGKTDRENLPQPTKEHLIKTKYIEPETETEKKLAQIWQEVLNIDKISRHDNFFDLGGHSLVAIRVLSRINQTFKINLGLRIIFEFPQIRELAKALENEAGKKHRTVAITIPKASKKKYYPLSYAQERMFVQYKIDPGSTLYNINAIFRPKEDIDTKQLERAVASMAKRHAVLRTKFKEVNGQAVQIVSDKSLVKLQVLTLPEKEKDVVIENTIETPFDLAKEFPLRVALFRQPQAGDTLVISVHHIITDQWSMSLFRNELFNIYNAYLNNKLADLPKLPIQYKDYAEWERSKKNQERLITQKKYWLARLGENPPVTKLPLDYPRESILEYQKGYVCDHLSNKTIERLHQIATDHNASLFMVLFTIANIYISRLTNKEDVVVGTSVAHRDHPELANLMGYLSNVIAIRIRLKENSSFEELLIKTRKNILRDYQNGEYPLEKLIDDLSLSRDVRNIRLFNILVQINENNKNRRCPKNEFNSNSLHSGKISNVGADNDWALIFEVYKDKVRLLSNYNAKVLSENTIKNWTTDLIHLIKQVAEDPEKRIGDYEAVSPQTKDKLLNQFNQTAKRQHPTKAPHHYFEEQARKTPKSIAAVYKGQKISYEKLNQEANRLASCLIAKGIKKGDGVAIDISDEHYLNIPKAILGAHKAGAAGMMIDREHPRERNKYILKKGKAKVIIGDDSITSYQTGKDVIKIDITKKLDKYYSKPSEGKGIEGRDTAFVAFTSGTTGAPKGIMVTARAMVNEAYYKADQLNIDEFTAIPMNFSLVITPSPEFICASFVLGKKLVIYPKTELFDAYAAMKRTDEHNIKMSSFTPSVLNSFLETVEGDSNNRKKILLKKLKLIYLSGEKTYPELAKRFYSEYPHITLCSEGGCSEVLSYSNGKIPNQKDLGVIKDGKAIRNQKVYILDSNQKLLPIGATGEIYISGYGLANGYLGDQKLTRERFLPHPFRKGELIFRTGDQGRIDNEGNIEIKGRVDDRVRIRGQRVELNEIREKVKKITWIKDVLVQLWEKGDNYDQEMVCYYTLKKGSTFTPQQIQSILKREVPKYMIPTYFVELKKFPLKQNGKFDKEKLLKPSKEYLVKTEYVPIKTLVERKMARIWQEVLNVEKIGRYDNFFDLGGHSLRAIQVLARVKNEFHFTIFFKDLFEHPTLSAISKMVEDGMIGKIIDTE